MSQKILSRKILVLDDEYENLEVLVECLQAELTIAEFFSCTDPEQARELILKEKPEVFLTDFNLKKATVVDLLETLIQEDQLPRVLLVMSGNENAMSEVAKVVGGENFRFFLKPVRAKLLAIVIRRELGQQ